jgi:serine/threonine protein phosphatase PrpC
MSYKSFSATATGISHTKKGKGCEDYSLHYPDDQVESAPLALAVVADGHGDDNCFRSAKGAEFAADITRDAIIEFVNRLEPSLRKIIKSKQWPSKDAFEKYIRGFVKHIIKKWHDKVEADYTSNPFTAAELTNVGEKYQKRYVAGHNLHHAYGATLIAAAITGDYWFGIHIGDGRFTALYQDGTFDQPVPWDERCFLNVTTSICDDDAFERARIYYGPVSEKPPAAVFLCSDGVDDNYPVKENEKYLYKLYRTIALTFVEDGFESTCGQLKDLANAFATNGKGDDTSIAGIIDLEAVKAIAPILQKQAEEDEQKAAAEKAAKAEEAQIAAEKAAAAQEKRAAEKERAEKAAMEKVVKAEESRIATGKPEAAHAERADGKAAVENPEPVPVPAKPPAENPSADIAKRRAAEAYEKQKTLYSTDPEVCGDYTNAKNNENGIKVEEKNKNP